MTSSGEAVYKHLVDRIQHRTDQLTQRAEQRKIERESTQSAAENVDCFLDKFNSKKENLEFKINKAGSLKECNNEMIDVMIEDLKDMQQFLNESSMFLASFQIKKGQETIYDLNSLIDTCVKELKPRKKFGFKKKMTSSILEKNSAYACKDSEGNISEQILLDVQKKTFLGFKDVEGQFLAVDSKELSNRQLYFQDLRDCRITALGNPISVQMSFMDGCTVLAGPASRSVFINYCNSCTIVIACQQMRIHNSTNCTIYLHVTGSVAIENCKEMKFAPYNLSYSCLEDHYVSSGLEKSINNWSEVNDFNWLNENENSPNFVLLCESEREAFSH